MFRRKKPIKSLIKAVKKGTAEDVARVLEEGEIADRKDGWGRTALMCAADLGDAGKARLLVEDGADLYEKDDIRRTALMRAAEKGHTDVVRLLAEKMENLDDRTKGGRTALIMAAEKGHAEIAGILVDNGASLDNRDSYGRTALDHAKKRGNKKIVKLLQLTDETRRRAAEEEASRITETWVRLGKDKVGFVGVYPEAKMKLTEIFNFATRKHQVITKDMDSPAETPTPLVDFDELPQPALEKALEEFKKLGGEADRDFVLGAKARLSGKPAFKP